jgi:FG-GAP-like repeat
MPDTISDNSPLTTQRLIQGTAGVQTFSSTADSGISLGPGDTDDYFKLTVSRSSNVVIKLYPKGNAKISLLDGNGNPSDLAPTTTSNPSGISQVALTDQPLLPGQSYYIRVYTDTPPTANIDYDLTVETLPQTRADVLWRNYSTGNQASGTNGIWLMNDVTFNGATTGAGPAVDQSWRIEGAGDFDGDGNADYLWHNTVTGKVGIWLMDASGNNIKSIVDGYNDVPEEWYVGGFGDFDRNGTLDIYWRNRLTGRAGVWLMNGTAFVGVAAIDNVEDINWVVEGVGDFDGNNTPDLFWRNTTTGQCGLWTMNGFTFTEAISLPTINDNNWRMGGVGDFNGDGKLDFVWRNYATGQNGIWIMNRTTYVDAISLPPVDAASGYEIADVLTSTVRPDIAGNSQTSAFNIGRLNNTANYVDKVSPGDPDDYYVFTIDSLSAKVSASLSGNGVGANAQLTIIPQDPANGAAIVSTVTNANMRDIAELALNKGTYFVRVQSTAANSQDYSLKIVGKEDQPVNLFFTPATAPTPQPIRLFQQDGTAITATTPVSVKTPFTLGVSYDFRYTGRPLNSFKVGFFISQDGVLDPADKRLQVKDAQGNLSSSFTVTGKLPDTTITLATNVVLPDKNDPYWIADGTYNIFVFLDPDNEIDEKDTNNAPKETDNTISTPILIRDARRPDLTIAPSAFTVAQTSQTRGSAVNLSGTLSNIGNASSDTLVGTGTPFEVGFYLSQDATFSRTTDLLLTTATFAPIAGGGSVAFNSNTLEPPTGPVAPVSFNNAPVLSSNWAGWRPAGQSTTYYIVAYVDPQGGVEEVTDGILNNTNAFAITVNA